MRIFVSIIALSLLAGCSYRLEDPVHPQPYTPAPKEVEKPRDSAEVRSKLLLKPVQEGRKPVDVPSFLAGKSPYQVPPVLERTQKPLRNADYSPLAWGTVGSYDSQKPELPASKDMAHAAPPMLSIPVSRDGVTVYPVDGEEKPYYTDMQYTAWKNETTQGSVSKTSSVADNVPLPARTPDRQYFFGYGSAKVSSTDKKDIEKVADDLDEKGLPRKVNVVGHASKRVDGVKDPEQKKMINYEMAQKRANAVSKELYAAGVEPSWVITTSKGDSVPNPNPGSRTQEQADRRVDLYVTPELK